MGSVELTLVIVLTCTLILGDRAVRAFLDIDEVGSGMMVWGLILGMGALVCLAVGSVSILEAQTAETRIADGMSELRSALRR